MTATYKNFYEKLGLLQPPFDTYTTELEKEIAPEIFVTQSGYDPIIEAFKSGRNIVLLGERGSGKTAILEDFKRFSLSENDFIVIIDDYSSLPKAPESTEIYRLIISALLADLFVKLSKNSLKLRKLNKEEKILLSYLFSEFLVKISRDQLNDKIAKIQLPFYKKTLNRIYNILRAPLNYGSTIVVNTAYAIISKYIPGLPILNNNNQIQEFFPQLELNVDLSFFNQNVSFDLLKRVGLMINKLGFRKPILLFDKFDEDRRLKNDADLISTFIENFMTDGNLLTIEEIQIVFSVWSTPFRFLGTSVRTQKYSCPSIKWQKQDLEDLINRRLSYYSNHKVLNYRSIFEGTVPEGVLNEIFDLSNANPRDLVHIFKYILEEQYAIDHSSEKISEVAIRNALPKFVTRFNYYEYYPRKANARSNTMDIYSYIAHLLKLNSQEFTKNQFNVQAGTGSSAGNYIVGMERIGLIENIRQEQGAAIYRIMDTKIKYCLKHNIDISRS